MEKGYIRHMALFTLNHTANSDETAKFLADGQRILSAIPVVRNFETLRQISPKTSFDFAFSMEFASQADYDAYNAHPDHVAFVEQRWKVEVMKYQEIDLAV